MGINQNAQSRRIKAMLTVDRLLLENKEKYGHRVDVKKITFEDAAEETFYDFKTIERYYNEWQRKKGRFRIDCK